MRRHPRQDDHEWAQRHLSHHLEGDLSDRDRRRLERHAADCPDCSRGLRAMAWMVRRLAHLHHDRSPQTAAAPTDGRDPAEYGSLAAAVIDRLRREAPPRHGPRPRPR